MSIAIAFIGGFGLAIIPGLVFKQSLSTQGIKKAGYILATIGLAVILLAFFFSSFLAGLMGLLAGITCFYLYTSQKRSSEVILEESVDPKINAELEQLSSEVKKSNHEEIEPQS